jgi:hypothetical protein
MAQRRRHNPSPAGDQRPRTATSSRLIHQDGAVSLLTDIQAAATDPGVPLSDLLRKCQILAFRLRHEPFKDWVAHELGGYPDDATVPRYRGPFAGEMKADLAGPFGSGAKNVGVPTSNIPAEVREAARSMSFYQGVGMLEGLLGDAKRIGETRVMSPFSAELAALTPVWQNHQTISMWTEVPIASVAGILDAVRSKALEFVLEIEAENPEAGATATSEPPVPLARADAIFNTVIYGGQVAIGPKATVNVTPGDLASLMAYLAGQGVAASDRDELVAALKADKDKLGPRVKAWLGEMAFKAVGAGERVGEGAVGGVIAVAVARFLGLA